MTPLERLRLAVSLAHCVPGSELRLLTSNDETIVVNAHPAADLDACAMRRVVRAASCPSRPDVSERVVAVAYGGSLEDLGGGVFRAVSNGREQRWIASLLRPRRIADLLGDVGLHEVPDDAMHACLKPDAELGVTLMVITADDARHAHHLDEIATRAAAAIFVDEMWCSVLHHISTVGSAGDSVGDDARRSA